MTDFLRYVRIGSDDANGYVCHVDGDLIYEGGYGRQKYLSVKQNTGRHITTGKILCQSSRDGDGVGAGLDIAVAVYGFQDVVVGAAAYPALVSVSVFMAYQGVR